jgi:hypothetical protein
MEVVLALAIVALAIPVMFGMFSIFSRNSVDAMNREEVSRAFDAMTLFLNGNAPDASTGTALTSSHGNYFSSVLYWVQNPAPATYVYAYKAPSPNGTSTAGGYQVSLTAPHAGAWSGPLLAGAIKPLITNVQSNIGFLPSMASPYNKAYIPVEISIYALSAAGQIVPATPVDTYPTVILR